MKQLFGSISVQKFQHVLCCYLIFKYSNPNDMSIFCFANFLNCIVFLFFCDVTHHRPETEDEWKRERRAGEREAGKGRSLRLFNSTLLSKTKSFPLYSLGPTIRSLSLTVRLTEVFFFLSLKLNLSPSLSSSSQVNLYSVTDEPQSQIIFIKLYMSCSLTEAWGHPELLKHSQNTRYKPFVPGFGEQAHVRVLAMLIPSVMAVFSVLVSQTRTWIQSKYLINFWLQADPQGMLPTGVVEPYFPCIYDI